MPSTTEDRAPIVLLPPSEGKAAGGDGRPWAPDLGTCGGLARWREDVATELRSLDGGSAKLLGLKGRRLDEARDANLAAIGAPSLPAWRRYTGVVWEHLDPVTLEPGHRRRIFVPSGLLGLSRGDDPTPEYRLRMSVRVPSLGLLSRWWQPAVSAAVDRRCRGRWVVDLLPQEHRAAWSPGPSVRGVRVELVDRSGRPGGHFAKAAKGRLARQLLFGGIDALAEWDDERFDLSISAIGSHSPGPGVAPPGPG